MPGAAQIRRSKPADVNRADPAFGTIPDDSRLADSRDDRGKRAEIEPLRVEFCVETKNVPRNSHDPEDCTISRPRRWDVHVNHAICYRMMKKMADRLFGILVLCILLAGCTGKPEGVEPIRNFDVSRYGGQWFEIMRLDHRFERGLSNVTATYTLRSDGTIDVLNKGLDRSTCRWKEAAGHAVFQGDGKVASLSVTFFWPFAGGYHVVDLDQQSYEWALVSGPSREYLWILARKPDLDPTTVQKLVAEAQRLGFPVDGLIRVDHGNSSCPASR